MYTFLARQPIFDDRCNIYAYEILYRNAERSLSAEIMDGTATTKLVLSDAITLFGLDTLTNSKPAFINFTEELILDEFPLLAGSKEIVVELLEDIKVTSEIIEKVSTLKAQGYTIALDDYYGHSDFDKILPYIDILKVDFMQTDKIAQQKIAQKWKNSLLLLAEKVETNEEYEWAKSLGYQLFQGYFFACPCTYKKKVQNISSVTFLRLMSELSKEDVDFSKCCNIIRSDTVLTYKMLKKMKTVEYLRGNTIKTVENAMVMMGITAFKRWLLLIVARDYNQTISDELTRIAFLRGLYAEELMKQSIRSKDSENAFLVGMFSLIDQILGETKETLFEAIAIPTDLRDALLGKTENIYSQLLKFIIDYENQKNSISLEDLGITLSSDVLHKVYANCVAQADTAFNYL